MGTCVCAAHECLGFDAVVAGRRPAGNGWEERTYIVCQRQARMALWSTGRGRLAVGQGVP
jgi:hypothetical protein